MSGAFTKTGTAHTKSGTDGDGQAISFSARNSSAAYGGSSTVQPAAIRALAIIKT